MSEPRPSIHYRTLSDLLVSIHPAEGGTLNEQIVSKGTKTLRERLVSKRPQCLSTITIALAVVLFCPGAKAEDQTTLTWKDCLVTAAQNHPNLISAQEVIKQREAAKDIAASGLLPQVSAEAAASRARNGIGIGKAGTNDSYTYGVSAQQLLFDGFKKINNTKSASLGIDAATEQFKFTSGQVRYNLRTAFVDLLRAQEMVKTTQEIVDLRKQEVDLITLRYQSGLEHRGALLTTQANLAQADFELAQAKRDIRLFQRELAVAMGWDDFKPLIADGDLAITNDDPNLPDFDNLVNTQPQFLAAIAKSNGAGYDLKAAYGDFFPQIMAAAGYSKSDTNWPPSQTGWNTGVSLNLPLFEGGLRLAQVREAKAAQAQDIADEHSTRNSLVFALEKTWTDWRDAVEMVTVDAKVLEAADQRREIAEEQYSIGSISYDNYIIIVNDFVNAKKADLNAKANALYTQANWVYAKGETLEYVE